MPRNSRVRQLLSSAASAMLYAALGLLLLLAALVVVQVICRNVFDLGLPWADELARFCGMALVFLAMPRLLLDGRHIAMDLVPNLLPRRWRAILGIVCGLLTLAFSGVTLWALYKFLARAGKFSTPELDMPNLVYYLPAILGFIFFAAVAAYWLFTRRDKAESCPEPDA